MWYWILGFINAALLLALYIYGWLINLGIL